MKQATLLAGVLALFSGAVFAASDADTVVARQGAAVVTYADVDAFISGRVPPDDRPGYMNSPKRIESTVRQLLVQKQLAAEARKMGLEKDDDVKRALALAAEQVLMAARMDRFEKSLKVPDFSTSAEEEYLAHKADYAIPGSTTVRHILISKEHRTEAELQKLADQVEKELKAHPNQFEALVEKYSDDPSKTDNKGVIPDATSQRMDGAFAAASAKLQTPGEVSPQVRSAYGIHLIQLVSREPGTQRSFADVKDGILKRLRKEWIEQEVRKHVDQVRNNPMDPNPKALAALRTRYMPPGSPPTAPDEDPVETPAAETKAGH